MNRLLIFVTMLCLSLSATQAYADSPIFMDKFKSIFSGSSEKVKPTRSAKKPLSLKTKTAKRSANDRGSSAYTSVSDRFKKAENARDQVLSKRKAKKKRMIQERVMLAEQKLLKNKKMAEQIIANAQQNAASGNKPDRATKAVSKKPSSKRFVLRKSKDPKVNPEKGSFPAPIFKNFR